MDVIGAASAFDGFLTLLLGFIRDDVGAVCSLSAACGFMRSACRGDGVWRPLYLCHIGAVAEDVPPEGWFQAFLERRRTRGGWLAAACTASRLETRTVGKEAAVSSLMVQRREDGSERLVSSSFDGVLRSWDAATGEVLSTRSKTHVEGATAAACGPRDSIITGGRGDAYARQWLPRSKNPVAVECGGRVRALACRDSILAVAAERLTVVDLAPSPPKVIMRWRSPTQTVEFSADGRRLLTSSASGHVRMWDVSVGATGAQRRANEVVLGSHSSSVKALKWGGGRHAVSVDSFGKCMVWDVSAETHTTTLDVFAEDGPATHPPGSTTSVWESTSSLAKTYTVDHSLDSSSPLVAAAGNFPCANVFDMRCPAKPVLVLGSCWPAPSTTIFKVDLVPDLAVMLTCHADGCVRLWDTRKVAVLADATMAAVGAEAGAGADGASVDVGRLGETLLCTAPAHVLQADVVFRHGKVAPCGGASAPPPPPVISAGPPAGEEGRPREGVDRLAGGARQAVSDVPTPEVGDVPPPGDASAGAGTAAGFVPDAERSATPSLLPGHEWPVFACNDGSTLDTGSAEASVWSVVLSPDRHRLWAGSVDGSVHCYALPTEV